MVLLAISAGRPARLRWLACSPVGVPSSSTPRNRSPPSVLARATTAATRSRSGRLLTSLLNSTARLSPPRMSARISCSAWCMAIPNFDRLHGSACLNLDLAALLDFSQQGLAQGIQVPVHITLVGQPGLVERDTEVAGVNIVGGRFLDLGSPPVTLVFTLATWVLIGVVCRC